jgi:hypothetical protein
MVVRRSRLPQSLHHLLIDLTGAQLAPTLSQYGDHCVPDIPPAGDEAPAETVSSSDRTSDKRPAI